MAEPLNITIAYSSEDITPPTGSFTATAFESEELQPIGPGYILRWTYSNVTQTGFTLTVAYLKGSPLAINNQSSDVKPFNVVNYTFDNPIQGTFYKINTSNPINITLKSAVNNNPITNNANVHSLTAESIIVEYAANPDTLNNYAPEYPHIEVVEFDNKPFTRTLKVNLLQNLAGSTNGTNYVTPSGTSKVVWSYNTSGNRQNVRATDSNGTPLPLNVGLTTEEARTVFFYLTTDKYNYKTQDFDIYATTFRVESETSLRDDAYILQYDTFPDIDLELYVNYENTGYSDRFYRLTSSTPYTGKLSAYSPDLFLTNTNFQEAHYKGWYTYDGNTVEQLTPTFSINRNTPRTRNITLNLSAYQPPDSFASWFSPHTYSKNISAIFVNSFITADFVGYPGSVFLTNTQLEFLDKTNFETYSKGMFFIGEGHTDYIFLCATPINDPQINYNWTAKTNTKTYEISADNLNQPLSSVFIELSSALNTDVIIPVTLHVTNNFFTLTDPLYYYDDTTGARIYYPYYISTLAPDGTVNPSNTKLRESIRILPYNSVKYSFNPGFTTGETPVFLQDDGSLSTYQASLKTDTNVNSFVKCADKYNELWKWSTFENCDEFANRPTTWASVSCTGGLFPKKWRIEGLDDTSLNPLSCYKGPITWYLSSSTGWSRAPVQQDDSLFYLYDLKVNEFGTEPLTISFSTPTTITIKAEQTVTCKAYAENTDPNNRIKSNDWLEKASIITPTAVKTFATKPSLRLYTPNRFVLTGNNIQFENLITQKELLENIKIDFDDNKIINVPKQDFNKTHFSTGTYSVPGEKTITITADTTYQRLPIKMQLPNIFTILPEYDTVVPEAYRSRNVPIELPWLEPPVVGSNDWVTNDNINSCFKKLSDNLNYLVLCSKVYTNKYTTYFGNLATPPLSALSNTGCSFWSWLDVMPFTTALPYTITWRDVLSGETFVENGDFVKCGKWLDHTREINKIIPTCFQKYNLEWSWRARKKANTITPITWQEAQCNQKYEKRWYYESSSSFSIAVGCDEGYWHSYIPGLDRYYQTIATPLIQDKCIYTGITSKNNILYTTQKTQIKLLSSDYTANYFDVCITTDGVRQFSDIKGISLNSKNTIYILDGILNQVIAYDYKPESFGDKWKLFTNWGGFAGRFSKIGFNSPNDIHVDQLDNVWICDTGNNSIKHFSSLGTWINTIGDDRLLSATPLSLTVDSEKNVHVLTNKNILIYSYDGEYITSYDYKNYVFGNPVKIITSYNREVIYLATNNEVIKFFRNGIFYNYILQNRTDVNNIKSLYHDEFRNLLITTDDKVLKYTDLMYLDSLTGDTSQLTWPLSTIYIHSDEYVQNWVYSKAFQRMWDNIEFFRNSLFYNNSICKGYTPPLHGKEKMIFGQNEIVTSATINRNFMYLWENFYTLVKYFDPNCKENNP